MSNFGIPAAVKKDRLAVVSATAGVCAYVIPPVSVFGAVAAIVTGHLAARRAEPGSENRSYATAGLIFGYSYLFALVTGFWYAMAIFGFRASHYVGVVMQYLD